MQGRWLYMQKYGCFVHTIFTGEYEMINIPSSTDLHFENVVPESPNNWIWWHNRRASGGAELNEGRTKRRYRAKLGYVVNQNAWGLLISTLWAQNNVYISIEIQPPLFCVILFLSFLNNVVFDANKVKLRLYKPHDGKLLCQIWILTNMVIFVHVTTRGFCIYYYFRLDQVIVSIWKTESLKKCM